MLDKDMLQKYSEATCQKKKQATKSRDGLQKI